MTQIHVESIIRQDEIMGITTTDGENIADLKSADKERKDEQRRAQKERIDNELPDSVIPFVKQARDKGASTWLNTLPFDDQQFNLNKAQFRDALCLRYNLPIEGLPTKCPCGQSFSVSHALLCKKGGFISQRHNNVRDLLTNLLSTVCQDVEAEPHLLPITNEIMNLATANKMTTQDPILRRGVSGSAAKYPFLMLGLPMLMHLVNKIKQQPPYSKHMKMPKRGSIFSVLLKWRMDPSLLWCLTPTEVLVKSARDLSRHLQTVLLRSVVRTTPV